MRQSAANSAVIPPRLAGYPILGQALSFRKDPPALFMEAQRRHGDVVCFRLGPRQVYLAVHPDHVKRVLQDNVQNYPKSGYSKLKPLIGNGLLSNQGEPWRRQRRLIQPAFHAEYLRTMAETMAAATQEVIVHWKASIARGQDVFNIESEMTRLTLAIVSRTLFSTDVSEGAGNVAKALRFVLRYGTDRVGRFFAAPHAIPTPKNLRYRRALHTLDEVVYGLISQRRKMVDDKRDLLAMLLQARDAETGEAMSEKQLRDEVMTLLTAGHETTAKALSWAFYLMDRNPKAADELRRELVWVLRGKAPTYDDLPNLTYTKMFIQESMRIFTPVWGLARRVREDDTIGGFVIPKGSRVIVSPYATHRHPKFWPNPEHFDPNRFTPEQSKGRPHYAYFPFGGGPRKCIGAHFAMMEAQIILSMVAQEFRLSLVPGHPVETEAIFTLRPKNGIAMNLAKLETTPR